MWAGYFAVRPVRETVAINFIGRENVADLWLFTALFSILIIPAYGAIVGTLAAQHFPARDLWRRGRPASRSSASRCRRAA